MIMAGKEFYLLAKPGFTSSWMVEGSKRGNDSGKNTLSITLSEEQLKVESQ